MKLNEQQLAALSSPKVVSEYLEERKESIISVIKQNLAVGDIFKRENLEVCDSLRSNYITAGAVEVLSYYVISAVPN